MRFGVLAILGLTLLAGAAWSGWRIRHAPVAAVAVGPVREAEPRRVAWFSLMERSGKSITLDDLRGKVWVASFFFSNCPGVCLKLNQAVADLQRELKDPDVEFVSITVDPEHDSPEQLTEYAARFHADPKRWLFLTGPMDQIKQIATGSFQVAAGPATHSDRLMVVDRQGRLRASFRSNDDAQIKALKRKVRELIKENV